MAETKFTQDKRVFPSGAVRNSDAGKPRYGLIPPGPLRRLAMKYTDGAAHYGDSNWRKGINLNSFVDSALRHIEQWRNGETDEDHLAAAVWNLFCIMYFEGVGRYVELGPVYWRDDIKRNTDEIKSGIAQAEANAPDAGLAPERWNDAFKLR